MVKLSPLCHRASAHDAEVWATCFAGDATLVTGSLDESVKLWVNEEEEDAVSLENLREKHAYTGHTLGVCSLDANAAATQLARAEAKLEEVTRREAGLEQRLIFEREAKEALEETAARERAAAARAAEDASRVAGEAASLRREVTEQRGAQHELQRLLAERDGSLAVIKAQLADAEGKYASTRAGTEPELRGRLHEVERRAAEMARELGAKGAALQALERQLGERTAEAATERERAERSRHRVRALEAELRAERSRDSSSAGASGGAGSDASRGDAGRGEKRTRAPPPPRFPAAERKARQKRVAEVEARPEARSEKEKTAAKEAAKEKAQAAVAAATELETSGADGSLGSLLAGDGANAVVVNVLDHLSLSGYVSPLAKGKAAEPAGAANGRVAFSAAVEVSRLLTTRSRPTLVERCSMCSYISLLMGRQASICSPLMGCTICPSGSLYVMP